MATDVLNDSVYLFESTASANFYASVYPDLAHRFQSFESLVFKLVPDSRLAKPERELNFQQLFPEELANQALPSLSALETLRHSGVLGPEDADFCFGTLSDSPKNRKLRVLFDYYIESPLERDWPWHITQAVEGLKQGTLSFAASGPWKFVPGFHTSALFRDLAAALVGPEPDFVEPWNLTLPDTATGFGARGMAWTGRTVPSVERLGRHLIALLKRGVEANHIFIPWQGPPQALAWLRYYLAFHHVPYRDEILLSESQAEAKVPWTTARLVAAVRRDSSLNLKDRLQLASRLIGDPLGRRPSTPWETYFEKLKGMDRLTSAEVEKLSSIIQSEIPSAVASQPVVDESSAVLLMNFQPMTVPRGYHCLTFADASLGTLSSPSPLLRSSELEALGTAGFGVPKSVEHRARMDHYLESFAQSGAGHRFLFTSLEHSEIPERVPHRALAATEPASVAPETAPVPLKLPPKPFSATQLETYARCPAQYFFSQRLRLNKADTGDNRYPLLFGQAVHLALETYFRKHVKETEVVEADLLAEFEAALKKHAPTLDTGHPFHTVLTENFKKLAAKVPLLEKQLASLAGLTHPLFFEKAFTLDIDGIQLKGKIDRIDETKEGAILVLDYKTGNVDFTPDHISQGTHFQALLYLLAMESLYPDRPSAGLLFYDLKKGELRRGLLTEERWEGGVKRAVTRGHVLPEARLIEIKKEGLAQLKAITAAIREGDFRPRPSAAICATCDYAALCRKGLGYV